MGRTIWYGEDGLRRGEWTADEDRILFAYVMQHGIHDWSSLPPKAGLQRCGKSCRLRWLNYLKPGIKKGKFSPQEEDTIIQLHALLGNRWASMARQMPNRTDNDIKNHWNSCLKKRLKRSGIDPETHQPIENPNVATSSSSSAQLLNRLAARISSSTTRHRSGDSSSLDCCMERVRTVLFPDAVNNGVRNDDVVSDQNDAVLTWDEEDAKALIEELSFLEDVTTSFSDCGEDHYSASNDETPSFPW